MMRLGLDLEFKRCSAHLRIAPLNSVQTENVIQRLPQSCPRHGGDLGARAASCSTPGTVLFIRLVINPVLPLCLKGQNQTVCQVAPLYVTPY